MRKILLFTINIIIFYFIGSTQTTIIPKGNPFVQTYGPDVYQANNQNWAVVQDHRGIMYFGNTNGILEYDNNTWRIIQSSTNSTIRTIEIAPDSTIYAAGNGDLGYLVVNKKGHTVFYSLLNKLPEEERKFNQIRKLATSTYGAYFFTKDKIFIYHADTFQIVKFVTLSLFCFSIDNIVYIIGKDNAIYAIQDNKITKLPGTENFAQDAGRVVITKFNNQKILLITDNKGLFTYDISIFFDEAEKKYNFNQPYKAPLLNPFATYLINFIKENNVYSAYTLKDGNIAIGTIYSGLIIIDTLGNIIQVIKKSNRLFDNAITSIYQDHLNNIWVTHLKGISYIHYNTQIFYFSENEGIDGSVYKTFVDGKTIYIGTVNGLFYLDNNDLNAKNTNALKYIEGTKERVWDITKIDDFIVISTSSYLAVLKNNKIIQQYSIKDVYCLKYINDIPDKIFFGTSEGFGFVSLKIQNGKFVFGENFNFPEIKTPIRNIVFFSNSFWLGSSFDGVYQIELKNLDNKDYKIIHYDRSRGLYKLENTYPFVYEGKLYFGCNDTIRQPINYSARPVKLFEGDKLDTIGINFIHKIKDKIFIVTSNSAFGYLKWDEKLKKYILKRDAGAKIKGFQVYDMFVDSNNVIYLSTNKGLVRYETEEKTNYKLPFNTLIRRIRIGKDSMVHSGNFVLNNISDSIYKKTLIQNPNPPLKFEYKYNSIKFFFSTTQYEVPEGTKYSYWLEGFEEGWSDWTDLNSKEYSYLREGKYTFHVKAKNLYDVESQETTYTFIVLPPWYRTTVAYIAYLLFLVGFIWLVVYLNSLRLKAENKRLEKIIEERTAEIRQKNVILTQQKEEIQAQAETLAALNIELEKLAIVARETDNSIIIMDKDGKLLWANHGFEKLYGIPFYTLIEKFGDNIRKVSSNKNINEIIEQIYQEKKSYIYESEFRRDGKRVWLQTTLTPILDNDQNITKLIAVETDISKIKEYEIEILNKNEEINAQKEELESINNILNEQNEFIKAGIRYAKNIQRAILPMESSFPNFVETFILYLPKDIVSGDFYWYTKVDTGDRQYYYFAAVDCTGHGVPGAFMSLIANRMLTETVNVERYYETNDILTQLKEKVTIALQQKETGNQDGMDLVLVRIEKITDGYNIQFSGAKRPLIVFNSQTKTVENYKADRISIGGYDTIEKIDFTATNLKLKNNDILYLSTDGYIDQNNPNRKRLGTASLETIITEINEMPMKEQKEVFHKVLVEWMAGEMQRDDITLMGIRLL